uniref:G-protein coupled receptors family 1 profile domain-containing protein n=1 Tax=Sphenodon punctatus TaxID=8508 RepID=A0A8D0L3Y1_SPHPU
MAYDRYLAVCRPLHYATIMSPQRCQGLAVTSWVAGFFLSAVDTTSTFRLPFCGPNRINHFFCEVPAVQQLACANTASAHAVVFIVDVLILLSPFTFILGSYLLIVGTVLCMRSAESRQRAFSTCTSHLTAVTFFYSAAIYTYMRPQHSLWPTMDKTVSVSYTIITPMLNPLIYSLRNKEVKGALARTIHRGLRVLLV